jgi:ribosomal protein L17
MGLKKYILSTLLLIIVIAGYVYSIEAGDYKIILFDYPILLPIAIWAIIPAFILFLATILHMLYYSFKQFLYNKSIIRDKDKLINLIKKNLTGSKHQFIFKTDILKEIGNILHQLDISINDIDFEVDNKSLNNLGYKILKINNGEYTSLKEFKLPNDNLLMIKNNINKTKIDESYCINILNKSTNYSQELIESAFSQTLKNKSFSAVKKLIKNLKLTKKMTLDLISTDALCTDKSAYTTTEIIDLLLNIELTKSDYISIAKKYTSKMSPDHIIKLFEDISSKHEEANEAYLFILFEYEMIDDIREMINNSQKDEYIPYKALLDLKDNGKQYNIDSICYKN